MKLLTFIQGNDSKLGIKLDQDIIDVSLAIAHYSLTDIPQHVHEVIESGTTALLALQQLIDLVNNDNIKNGTYWVDEATISFGACVTHPNKNHLCWIKLS